MTGQRKSHISLNSGFLSMWIKNTIFQHSQLIADLVFLLKIHYINNKRYYYLVLNYLLFFINESSGTSFICTSNHYAANKRGTTWGISSNTLTATKDGNSSWTCNAYADNSQTTHYYYSWNIESSHNESTRELHLQCPSRIHHQCKTNLVHPLINLSDEDESTSITNFWKPISMFRTRNVDRKTLPPSPRRTQPASSYCGSQYDIHVFIYIVSH